MCKKIDEKVYISIPSTLSSKTKISEYWRVVMSKYECLLSIETRCGTGCSPLLYYDSDKHEDIKDYDEDELYKLRKHSFHQLLEADVFIYSENMDVVERLEA